MDPLRYIFNVSPNGLLLLEPSAKDDDWRCTLANKAASALLGQSTLKGKPLHKLLPAAVTQNLAHAPANSIDFFLNEHNRWILASINQKGKRMAIALTDITQMKESNFAEHRLMRLYKSLTYSLEDNEIILFDKDFNILLSEGVPRFIRLDLEGDLKGKNLKSLFETNSFTFLGEHVSKVFGGERAEIEQEINGRIYKASLYSDKRDESNLPDNLVGVLLLKDVSELNKKQRELEIRLQQLDRSNRELQQFAYVASHDLQEPLRKIMSFSERLLRKYDNLLVDEGKEYIIRMSNAAQRMETLIYDLLSFSRSTQMDQPFELTDLNHIFADVLADMDTREQSNAQINLPLNLPVLEAIPSQMRQLFQNLLNNALKFAHAQRAPIVSLRCQLVAGVDLPEHYALLPEKDYCIIEIEDNGIGFHQSNAERIFNIFQRLHGRSEYSGSGVGLAICKKIADNHQGALFADGYEGKGAVFKVVLPLKQ
jgi:signal transduction histidine kinase